MVDADHCGTRKDNRRTFKHGRKTVHMNNALCVESLQGQRSRSQAAAPGCLLLSFGTALGGGYNQDSTLIRRPFVCRSTSNRSRIETGS